MTTFLIVFPTKDDRIENIVIDKQSGNNFVKEMMMILDRIDCEKDIEVYINSSNKDKFIDDYKTLEDLINQRIGLYNIEDALRSFITQNAIRILHAENFEPDIYFQIADGFRRVDNIFTERNGNRILNQNDFRHCENHPGYLHHKSPLIGGTAGFANVSELLPSAIGDNKANRGILLNIDTNNSDFIVRYEDENFNNQYHAFHLVKNVNNDYIVDAAKIQLLQSSRKNLKRPLMLVRYRHLIA